MPPIHMNSRAMIALSARPRGEKQGTRRRSDGEGEADGGGSRASSPSSSRPSPPAGVETGRATSERALYRLLGWLSPGFPIGAFSYSHGLEAAVESDAVRDRASLQAWIAAVVVHGSGRVDADILRDAHRAAEAGELAALAAVNRRGLAYRPTAELALETTAQGAAFLATCRAAWPDELLEQWMAGEDSFCYPAVVGAATARAGIALVNALIGYLQAMTSNLVSAGLRLGIIGQIGGQRILAALEAVVIDAADIATRRDPADFGGAAFAVDLASIAHETQYTRLFRS
jgi:urease accessory protein